MTNRWKNKVHIYFNSFVCLFVFSSEEESRLIALEDHAKSQNVGKWSKSPESEHIRDVKYTLENPTHFVDSFKQKAQEGTV